MICTCISSNQIRSSKNHSEKSNRNLTKSHESLQEILQSLNKRGEECSESKEQLLKGLFVSMFSI